MRTKMGTRTTLRAAALLACAATVACARERRYHDAEMDFAAIRTVAVLPFANLSREQVAGDRVRDVFTNMLLATNAVYVVPPGETARGLIRVGIQTPSAPSIEEITKLGTFLKADAVVTGTVKEYGEVRSGSAVSNVIAVSLQMYETQTGKLVWSASSTRGGVTVAARMFGGGGAPINDVTEAAIDELLSKMFK